MSVNIVNNGDGSMGLAGTDGGPGEVLWVEIPIVAASVSASVFIAPRAMKVTSIRARMDTAGTDASAVTAVINKAVSATAIGSGVIVHSGTINLKGTAATNQAITVLATAAATLAQGDAIAIVYTGTLTAAVGSVTVGFSPL